MSVKIKPPLRPPPGLSTRQSGVAMIEALIALLLLSLWMLANAGLQLSFGIFHQGYLG